MTAQRISDHRMVVRGAMIALICGCWLLASAAAAQEATPRAAPATAPAKRVPPSRKPGREEVRVPTIYYLKHADAASVAEMLASAGIADNKETKVAVDKKSNRLLVSAPRNRQEQVEKFIEAVDRESAKQDDQRPTQIYCLKYAKAASLAELLSATMTDAKQMRITFDERLNVILVSASREQQEQVEDLIKVLDAPPARDVDLGFKVFTLAHGEARVVAKVVSELLGSADAKIAVDSRTNSILVQGPQDTLLIIDAILNKLDETADKDLKKYGPEATFRVRVVWLANGLSDDDAADPSADLKDVLDPLRLMGVKDLRQVGQVIVNSTPDGRFQVRCSPVLNKRPADLEISGEFDQQQETPTLKIELSASQVELPPATADGLPRRRGPERKPLVDLQTVIAAPLGHYVVLGVAPVEKMTSVFIVQVTAGK